MAKMTSKTGQASVVRKSPTRTGGSRATTSKQAGVKARRASVRTAVVRANARNASRRVKQFSTDDGLLDLLANLPARKMPAELVADKTRTGAQRRREWCEQNGVTIVRVYDDGIATRRATYAPVNENGWRPENGLRERLLSLAGIGVDGYGYTRTETNWTQYQQVMGLDWTNGEPADYHGADGVYLYRV